MRRRGSHSRGQNRNRRPKHVPTAAELERLLAAAPSPEMRAFSLTAAYSGLRLFEVAALRVEDVNLEARELFVRRGKGGYERTSLVYEPGLSALEEVVRGKKKGLIWRTSHGNPWSRQHVARLWTAMRLEAGVPAGCTFHKLRDYHCAWLLDQGASFMDVSIQLGHHDNGELVMRTYGRSRSEEAARRRLYALV